MPVMPISAVAAMTVFAVWRTTHSVVVTEETFIGGCLIWTAMNRSPATAAEMPAARVRLVGVTVMAGSLVLGACAGRVSGHVKDATNRLGDPASPCDVTQVVIRPPGYRRPSSVARRTRIGGVIAAVRILRGASCLTTVPQLDRVCC